MKLPLPPRFGAESDPFDELGFDEKAFLRGMRDMVEHSYPNPERRDCPPAARLRDLAYHKVPLRDSRDDNQHIVTCSPCFIEYHRLRRTWKRRRIFVRALMGVAAAFVLVTAGVTYVQRRSPVPAAPNVAVHHAPSPGDPVLLATLDLRTAEPTRGTAPSGLVLPVLRRAETTLTLLLPVGSDDGQYRIQIRDRTGATRLETPARAIIIDYITTIETTIDLRPLAPDRFTLAIRHAGEASWNTYPVEVR